MPILALRFGLLRQVDRSPGPSSQGMLNSLRQTDEIIQTWSENTDATKYPSKSSLDRSLESVERRSHQDILLDCKLENLIQICMVKIVFARKLGGNGAGLVGIVSCLVMP
jgi:hypothetical protein